VITPNVLQCQEKLGIVLGTLGGLLVDVRGKGGEYVFRRKAIDVFNDKGDDAVIQLLSVFGEDHLVGEPIVLFERQGVGSVALDLTDIVGKFDPDVVNRNIGAMLEVI